jgi:hypothetical protein
MTFSAPTGLSISIVADATRGDLYTAGEELFNIHGPRSLPDWVIPIDLDPKLVE